jgi:nickel-dependent lactate racemase
MPQITLPYGRETLTCDIPNGRLTGVLVSRLHGYRPPEAQEDLVRAALERPVGSPPLRELVAGKKHVVIIASDHTRPVPSKILMPLMLAEIRKAVRTLISRF